MTADLPLYLTTAATSLIAVSILAFTALKGFSAWLDLQRAALGGPIEQSAVPGMSERIELADLRERLRKLEAIAAGIDV